MSRLLVDDPQGQFNPGTEILSMIDEENGHTWFPLYTRTPTRLTCVIFATSGVESRFSGIATASVVSAIAVIVAILAIFSTLAAAIVAIITVLGGLTRSILQRLTEVTGEITVTLVNVPPTEEKIRVPVVYVD